MPTELEKKFARAVEQLEQLSDEQLAEKVRQYQEDLESYEREGPVLGEVALERAGKPAEVRYTYTKHFSHHRSIDRTHDGDNPPQRILSEEKLVEIGSYLDRISSKQRSIILFPSQLKTDSIKHVDKTSIRVERQPTKEDGAEHEESLQANDGDCEMSPMEAMVA